MKKIYIIIIVLIVLGAGFWLFMAMGKKAEAPVVETPGVTPAPAPAPSIPPEVACTMDAKLCPDGSYVGRVGPKCEFSACPSSPNTQVVKEFVVTGQNFSFTPNIMTVKKGDKVKITFKNANGTHNLILDEFNVATSTIGGGQQQTVEFIADKVGSFEYYCSVGAHRAMGMKGTLKVE